MSDENLLRGLSLVEDAAKTEGYAQARWALLMLGKMYDLKYEFTKARAAFNQVIEDWPDSPAAAMARGRLIWTEARAQRLK